MKAKETSQRLEHVIVLKADEIFNTSIISQPEEQSKVVVLDAEVQRSLVST